MKDAHDVVRGLLRTEKGTYLLTQNKYQFLVDMRANKIEIRNAVEEIYKVKVAAVNTAVVGGKMRRVRYKMGKRPDWKKALVTLKQGEKIDVT